MSEIEAGMVLEGEVTNVVAFGAFVKFEDNSEGLIHISEIANEYVNNINDFVKVGQKVKVKVIGRNKQNKLELSIKRLDEGKKKETLFIYTQTKNSDFEDKLTRFLKRSEEKQIDLRRNLKEKQGIAKRRK